MSRIKNDFAKKLNSNSLEATNALLKHGRRNGYGAAKSFEYKYWYEEFTAIFDNGIMLSCWQLGVRDEDLNEENIINESTWDISRN